MLQILKLVVLQIQNHQRYPLQKRATPLEITKEASTLATRQPRRRKKLQHCIKKQERSSPEPLLWHDFSTSSLRWNLLKRCQKIRFKNDDMRTSYHKIHEEINL
ncbi:hypothetical protein Y1Q_0003859 [Alligator mississippiensis]|uniref:Uncharacterized protein n=1 Tax=Alligator mississippiensis TaxID=8496 RepID=A0A151MNI9_ALLMI|nr:hypothetical protein Y1Q_0003859 [Alligator mississippiensis]